MDESLKLYEELLAIRKRERQIRAEVAAIVEGMEQTVLKALCLERLCDPNDPGLKEIQATIRAKKHEIGELWKDYHSELGATASSLRAMTAPVIKHAVGELRKLEQEKNSLLERRILNKKYLGVSKKWSLEISTNEKVIRKIRALVQTGITKLEGMGLSPTSDIELDGQHFQKSINDIELTMETLTVDEADFVKGSPPPVIDPTYGGSLTGQDFPPPKSTVTGVDETAGSRSPWITRDE